jgi:rare lipoprotein A (peptidoglycan hydrolase)
MLYKKSLYILIFLLLMSCSNKNFQKKSMNNIFDNSFSNKGFALIYNENLFENKIISKKIDERSLIIFQRNLKINTQVKITNILNNKSIIAKVGKKSNYPSFNNSVLSIRIAKDLDLDLNEPYVEIIEIKNNTTFIAKKAKTFDEEKKVASKAPVNSISINDLKITESSKTKKKKKKRNFSYEIKIASFYFEDTAKIMLNRIKTETIITNPKIKKISDNEYRVYLGPFDNIDSLKKSYNGISILEFDNIEIIKND